MAHSKTDIRSEGPPCINIWKWNKKEWNHNVRIEAHFGGSMRDMIDYVIKPPARRNLNLLVLHCGTNDLRKEYKQFYSSKK